MRVQAKYVKHSVLVRKVASWRMRACFDICQRQYKVRTVQCKGKQEPLFNRIHARFHANTPGHMTFTTECSNVPFELIVESLANSIEHSVRRKVS